MPQQINLHTPVLLTQRRLFSARAMAAALAVFAAGLLGLSVWLQWSTQATRAELEHTLLGLASERAQLAAAIAARPADDATSLQQRLQDVQADVTQQRATLVDLRRGLHASGQGHAALLRLIAQSLPADAWLSEVRLAEQRFEVSGETLDPASLQPWIERLAAHPLLAGQPLATLRVERRSEGGAPERWRFTLVNAPAAVRTDTALAADTGATR